MAALERVGLELVPKYPRVSQGFNAIENVWKKLRDRLATTLPQGREIREDFIFRRRSVVSWLNRNKAQEFLYLCTNQKERCRECLSLTPPGSRTGW